MPDWALHVRPRLASLRLSPTRENDIVEELSQHLEERWQDLMAGGMSDDEAARAALTEFNEANLLALNMAPLRQARTPPPVTLGAPTRFLPDDLWRDLRYAGRTLRKRPTFAASVIVTLALAIGATTAIFAVVDTLLLRTLPFPDSNRLVDVRTYPSLVDTPVSVPEFMLWRSEGRQVFSGIAAYYDFGTGFNLIESGVPERLVGSHVSADFFDVMGVPPALGRGFRQEEDVPGGPWLVVLSHAVWKNRLAGSTDIIGQAITLNGKPYTVVGVMPEGFRYPDAAQLWTLTQFDPASRDRASNFKAVARLTPETTLDQARAAMAIAGAAVRRTVPGLMGDNDTVGVRSLRDVLYGDMRRPLLILLTCVGFVFLIACVNIANLQLAEAADRRGEIALRTALGASTSTLVRQLFVESLLLAGLGGAAGVALAYALMPILLALSPVNVPYADRIAIDGRTLAFALAISLAASLAFGLLPAWQSARPDLEHMLRGGGQRVAGRTGRTLRRWLVSGEVALALMLTVGALLLVKSLVGLQLTPPGFAVEDVLTMKLALPEAKYGSGDALGRFADQVEEQASLIPGVHAAAVTHTLPLQWVDRLPFTIEGRYVPGTQTGVGLANFREISRQYFQALAIPVRQGRGFDTRDRSGSLPVAIINEAAARAFWPDQNPIGQRITVGQPSVPDLADPTPREIIGVVGDVRDQGLGASFAPILYVPISQLNDRYATLGTRLLPFAVVVRGDTTVARLTRSVQQAIWSVDPQQPITEVRLMRDIVTTSLGPQRFNTALVGGLAVLALLLAAVGLYGLISYLVIQQTQEIGVRIALGASRRDLLTLFLGQVLSLVAVGVGVGLAGAFGVTRLLRTLVIGVSTTDPWVFATAPALMFAVALMATLRPVLRAASVDPARALRAEGRA